MLSSSLMTRRAMAVAGVTVATALAGGAPALATDASLRKVVAQQEKKVVAAATNFTRESDDTASVVGREQASIALEALRTAVRRQKSAVTKAKASTLKVSRARTQYLAAVDSYATGLKTFAKGLEAFDPDSTSEAEGLFKKARAQLKSALTRRLRARKLIG